MTTKKLTIGSATYDDFEGVYFTYMSIQLACIDRLDELDLVIIDNNPESAEGKATADFCSKAKIRYFAEPIPRSTAIRDRIFRVAEAPFCVSIDPHVLFEPATIPRLIEFAQNEGLETANLFQGAMLYDYLDPEGDVSTHFEPVWRENMYGIWGCDKRAKDKEAKPFEIPMKVLVSLLAERTLGRVSRLFFKGLGEKRGIYMKNLDKQGIAPCCSLG